MYRKSPHINATFIPYSPFTAALLRRGPSASCDTKRRPSEALVEKRSWCCSDLQSRERSGERLGSATPSPELAPVPSSRYRRSAFDRHKVSSSTTPAGDTEDSVCSHHAGCIP